MSPIGFATCCAPGHTSDSPFFDNHSRSLIYEMPEPAMRSVRQEPLAMSLANMVYGSPPTVI
jgi:hypothetical protein